jgi:hypothetical protein
MYNFVIGLHRSLRLQLQADSLHRVERKGSIMNRQFKNMYQWFDVCRPKNSLVYLQNDYVNTWNLIKNTPRRHKLTTPFRTQIRSNVVYSSSCTHWPALFRIRNVPRGFPGSRSCLSASRRSIENHQLTNRKMKVNESLLMNAYDARRYGQLMTFENRKYWKFHQVMWMNEVQRL